MLAVVGVEHLARTGSAPGRSAVGERYVQADVDGPLDHRLRLPARPRRPRPPAPARARATRPVAPPRRPDRCAAPRRPSTWRPVIIISLARARPDQPRQPLRAAATGDDAEQDLRLTEHGPLAGDAVVARQRQLASAAEGVPADGGDDEPRDVGHRVQAPRGTPAVMRAASLGAAELADVGAGGEDPLAAGDDHRPRRVGGQLLGRSPQLGRAAPATAH